MFYSTDLVLVLNCQDDEWRAICGTECVHASSSGKFDITLGADEF